MKKIIKIGEKEIEFSATAMTDYLGEAVFGVRFMYALRKAEEDEYLDLVQKIAFIMAKQAELGSWREVNQLRKEDYYDWLDQFDSFEFVDKTFPVEIVSLYSKNKETKVMPKNQGSPHAAS